MSMAGLASPTTSKGKWRNAVRSIVALNAMRPTTAPSVFAESAADEVEEPPQIPGRCPLHQALWGCVLRQCCCPRLCGYIGCALEAPACLHDGRWVSVCSGTDKSLVISLSVKLNMMGMQAVCKQSRSGSVDAGSLGLAAHEPGCVPHHKMKSTLWRSLPVLHAIQCSTACLWISDEIASKLSKFSNQSCEILAQAGLPQNLMLWRWRGCLPAAT